MHTASSAKRTCKEFRSASEYTATVPIPSSLQAQITRRAISPRLATRIFLNIGWRLLLAARPDAEQRLPILHGLPVICEYSQHFSADVRLNFVHELHRFNDAERLAGVDVPTDFHKWLSARSRGAVERAHNRRFDKMKVFGGTRFGSGK